MAFNRNYTDRYGIQYSDQISYNSSEFRYNTFGSKEFVVTIEVFESGKPVRDAASDQCLPGAFKAVNSVSNLNYVSEE